MPPPRGTPNPIEGPGDYEVTSVVHNDTYAAISPLSHPPIKKAVFVVGASKGIGLAIAISYAQAGASHIAIGARSDLAGAREALLAAAAAAQRAVPQVLCIQIDVTSQQSTEDAAARVEEEFGRLDVLLINAGVLGSPALVADSDPLQWWATWDVNLRGPYLVSRAFLPLMLKRGGDKTIITTSSVGAHVTSPAMSAYQSSKLAVLRLMEFVNAEYGNQGVLAFCIHPGNIPTDIVGGKEGLREELRPIFVETAELSGDTIVYLTREKREWLGGRYINCTWDMPELMAQKDEIVKENKLKVRLVF